MAVVGADTNTPVTPALLQVAKDALGVSPAFFGRYFKNPQNREDVQYQSRTENPILHTRNIPVLCLARQTARVTGKEADGIADAVWNMAAVIEAFGLLHLHGLGFDPLIFLDTEPESPLSADYYYGW